MRPALGKGLDALISEETAATVTAPALAKTQETANLPITHLKPNPRQPRHTFSEESLKELATSLKQKGVLQPILVTSLPDGNYEIIAGERRWRAAQLAGMSDVPVIVKSATEAERFEMALIENIQREDLNPIDQAQGFVRLAEEFKLTQEDIAQMIGKDRAVVANTIRLLNLPPEMREALVQGKISAGHGRALVALDDPAAQADLFNRIVNEQLTVRTVENAVREHKQVSVRGHVRGAKETKSPEVKALEEDLQRTLARKVELQTTGPTAQKGWLKLEFYSLDDLDHLLAQLKRSTQPS